MNVAAEDTVLHLNAAMNALTELVDLVPNVRPGTNAEYAQAMFIVVQQTAVVFAEVVKASYAIAPDMPEAEAEADADRN